MAQELACWYVSANTYLSICYEVADKWPDEKVAETAQKVCQAYRDQGCLVLEAEQEQLRQDIRDWTEDVFLRYQTKQEK